MRPSLLCAVVVVVATVVTTVAVSGCGSSDDETPSANWASTPPVSGTRLRARVITGGGVRQLVGFRDVERNEDCTFQQAQDGRIRCLPATIAASIGFFSDSACQIPLAIGAGAGAGAVGVVPTCVGGGGAAPAPVKYAIVNRFDGTCGTQIASELRKISPADAASPRYTGAPGSCTLQQQPPGTNTSNATANTLGEVVPWTAFVEATETLVPGEAAAEKVLVTPDGARQHLAFRSEKADADCTFQVMADGNTRCVPAGIEGRVTYSDSGCTQGAFVSDYQSTGPCAKSRGRIWIEPKGVACGGIKSVYSLGSSSSFSGLSYEMTNSNGSSSSSAPPTLTCKEIHTSLPSGGNNSQRSIEADLTPSLPKATRVGGGGGGRLVPALVPIPASNGNDLEPGFHDNERDIDCTFTLASDNKLRCLPTASEATIFFTDTICKSPAVVAVLNNTPCVASAKLARVTNTSCTPTTRVFSLGTTARDLTNASTQVSTDRCPTFTSVTNAYDATEVDVSGFVEGVLTTE